MRRAIELAGQATGLTFPNPLVGAVVVSDGEVVGEGYHRGVGTCHAEVAALSAAGARAKGATLYLNLEPCCHFGKTPPCIDSIVSAGIRRVVFGIYDPDRRVRGKGAGKLRASGLAVAVGVCAVEALELNLGYVHRCITGKTFVVLKLAASLDGKLTATGRDWLTGPQARIINHRLRAQNEAIAVGIGTIAIDDPVLDRRFYGEQVPPPVRLIFDSKLRFPPDHAWLDRGERVVVYCARGADEHRKERLEEAGADVVALERDDGGGVDLRHWVNEISERGLTSVLVEGGGRIATSLIRDGLFDRLVIFLAPVISGAGGVAWFQDHAMPPWFATERFAPASLEAVGSDIMAVFDRERIGGYLDMVTKEENLVHGIG